MPKERIGITKLKKTRLKAGMTQMDMAKASMKSVRMYKYYESGEREPSVSTAIRIADMLGNESYEGFKELFPLPGEEADKKPKTQPPGGYSQ